ncbi:phage tail-collar fiber domain-containing protein [Serratia liquefaciens]|uniref:phage tail-collar fiber domain-containing protein n=1 Tax=Serratia liquefaciens TaxID=614 RepID=UPI000DFD7B4F|nr:phage tail protein [Serratia liquefaciens]MBF8107378.1 phage tail protein [Serratia liquefaciens]SUI44795.1 Tail fiber protein [Serratia liquefaciens]
MSAIITRKYEQWAASQTAQMLPARPDTFVFAYIPGQDSEAEISRDEPLPAAANIVHTAPVMQYGMLNTDAVVFSVVLDTTVGDFDYNWIGLLDQASNTLCMIVHTRTQRKIATSGQEQGNTLTRTLAMEFNGAAGTTQINVTPQTWQIDFSARLAGIDERQRLAGLDIYGPGAFFGDAFLVTRTGATYQVAPGVGYVGGLRAVLPALTPIAVDHTPTLIWADISLQGQVTSRWETTVKLTAADTLQNYIDPQGFHHYVTQLARINEDGSVTDLRPKGSQGEQEASRVFLRKSANLSDVVNIAASRDNLGLGDLATKDVLYAHDVGAYTQGEADQKFFPRTGGIITGPINTQGDVGTQGGEFILRNSDGVQIGAITADSSGNLTLTSNVSGRNFSLGQDGNFGTSPGVEIYESGQRVYSPNNKPEELHVNGPNWWSRDSSGKITQGGIVNRSDNSNPVSFNIPFPNVVLSLQMTLREVSAAGSERNIIVQDVTNSGFTSWMNENELSAYWLAVGY